MSVKVSVRVRVRVNLFLFDKATALFDEATIFFVRGKMSSAMPLFFASNLLYLQSCRRLILKEKSETQVFRDTDQVQMLINENVYVYAVYILFKN